MQLVALTDAIRAVRDDILIAVDHEGGRVQRFRTDGFTVLSAPAKLGALWNKDVLLAATKVATAFGYLLASELGACGVDMSFTPVLDLNYGQSQVIGDRALHSDPRVVTMLAKSLNHGLALAGMGNCGKHFPGHGFASVDSHVALPTDDRSLDEILDNDVRAVRLARHVADIRDSGACDLHASGRQARGLLTHLAAGHSA